MQPGPADTHAHEDLPLLTQLRSKLCFQVKLYARVRSRSPIVQRMEGRQREQKVVAFRGHCYASVSTSTPTLPVAKETMKVMMRPRKAPWDHTKSPSAFNDTPHCIHSYSIPSVDWNRSGTNSGIQGDGCTVAGTGPFYSRQRSCKCSDPDGEGLTPDQTRRVEIRSSPGPSGRHQS
jgi:hypothetical protein